jgi:lysophospholipid acyltransferase (LPLAT)-like uncharacterized protein
MNVFDPFWFLMGRLGRSYMQRVYSRCDVAIEGTEALVKIIGKQPCLCVFWHQHLLMADLLRMLPFPKTVVLSLDHYYGKLASKLSVVSKTIYVSESVFSKRKGFIEFMCYLDNERATGFITPDGEVGPARQVKPGCILLAKKLGIDIFPISFASTRSWHFSSWDRLEVPRPGASIKILIGSPLDVSSMTLEEGAKALELALNQLEKEAQETVCYALGDKT